MLTSELKSYCVRIMIDWKIKQEDLTSELLGKVLKEALP